MRAHRCQYCAQSFLRPEHLTRHIRGAHTNERPFACRLCSSTFHRQDVLNRHIKGIHKQDTGLSFRARTVADYEKGTKQKSSGRRTKRRKYDVQNETSEENTASLIGNSTDNATPVILDPQQEAGTSSVESLPTEEIEASADQVNAESFVGWGELSAFDWELTGADLSGLFFDVDGAVESNPWPSMPLPFNDPLESSPARFGGWIPPFGGPGDPAPVLATQTMSQTGHSSGSPESHNLDRLSHVTIPNTVERTPCDSEFAAETNSDRFFGVWEERKHSETSPTDASEVFLRQLPDTIFLDEEGYYIAKARVEPLLKHLRFPSRRVINRWLEAYFKGFNHHVPLLHTPTLDAKVIEAPLFLAMASIGALYCLERDRAWKLYESSCAAAYTIMKQRIPSHNRNSLFILQTLLLNVCFGVWSGDSWMFEESQATAARLAIMLHNEVQTKESDPISTEVAYTGRLWRDFIEAESFRRVYFCSYTLMLTTSEVFGIPVPIAMADCALPLPCSEAEWTSPSDESWQALLSSPTSRVPTPDYRTALVATLSGAEATILQSESFALDPDSGLKFTKCSSLGNHVLILSIFMHTYNLSVVKRSQNPRVTFHANEVVVGRIKDSHAPSAFKEQFPTSSHIVDLKTALKRWQLGWSQNPEALMSPTNPLGPVSFNSTAHYRLTNLRLYSDFTSIRRALRTQDALRVFQAMAGISGSPIQRTNDVTETTYPAIAALQIPIRMGVRLFAHTASLTWSIEHFLTGFECALFLAYWLLSLEREPDCVLSEHEAEMKKLVMTLVDESGEEIIRAQDGHEVLSVSVLRIWESIFENVWVWGITKIMGTSLGLFADHIARAVKSLS